METDGSCTYCGERFVIYINVESLCHTSETNVIFYVSYALININGQMIGIDADPKKSHTWPTSTKKLLNPSVVIREGQIRPTMGYPFTPLGKSPALKSSCIAAGAVPCGMVSLEKHFLKMVNMKLA